MKSVALLAALAGSAAAFTPAPTGKASSALAESVFDNYVGAVDFRGKEFKWDPVSALRLILSWVGTLSTILSECLPMAPLTYARYQELRNDWSKKWIFR